jgi:hypothetical protein
MSAALVLGVFVGVQAAAAPAQAATCPSGYAKVAVKEYRLSPGGPVEWRVNIYTLPSTGRVVAKVENVTPGDIVVEAWHFGSPLGGARLGGGQSWCSRTSPRAITVWSSVGPSAWYDGFTWPVGQPSGGPSGPPNWG